MKNEESHISEVMDADRAVEILLIEDSTRDAMLIEDTISQSASGFGFHRVDTEEELDRALAERTFDLVLSDHNLPALDSIRALKLIRRSKQGDLPFIIVSGSIGEEAAVAIMKAGASDYVSKDCLSRLVPAIARELQETSLRREKRMADLRLRELNEKLKVAVGTLTKTQNSLADLERYRSLGKIAQGVAHDFNNGLTKVLGLTELLMERCPQERESFDELLSVTRESAGAVQRLRHFSKKSAGVEAPSAPVDLSAVIRETVELTQPKWKTAAEQEARRIKVETSLTTAPPVVGNAAELREVFVCLVFNACDALPTGGTITVSTRLAGDFVVAEVKDTGIGMTDEIRRRCMEPFFTTGGENAFGLGLGLADSFLKRYGGYLEIASKHGEGTTATIYLKRHVAPTDEGSVHREQKVAGGGIISRHIMVVDDDPMVARLLKATLELDGHRVTVAHDGPEALHLFIPGEHEVVITDRAMPTMNGDQLCRALKGISPRLPVIMSSGLPESPEEPDPQQTFAVHMPKPVSRARLQQAISLCFPAGADGAIILSADCESSPAA